MSTLEKIRSSYTQQIRYLGKAQKKEKEKLEEKYRRLNEEVKKKYFKSACEIILNQLELDYNLLQKRSSLLQTDTSNLDKLTNIASNLSNFPEKESRSKAMEIVSC